MYKWLSPGGGHMHSNSKDANSQTKRGRGFTYVDGGLPTDDLRCQWCKLTWVKGLQVLQQPRHQSSDDFVQRTRQPYTSLHMRRYSATADLLAQSAFLAHLVSMHCRDQYVTWT